VIKKSAATKDKADVTFTIYPRARTRTAAVLGEWNNWAAGRVMHPNAEGGFSRTVRLDTGRRYEFKYLLDGHRWENDPAADAHAGQNSVVDLTAPELANGPALPGSPAELAAASADDFTGSAADRIDFLGAANHVLATAEARGGGGVPPELIPPITKVVLDVLDFIDRDLEADDLYTMTKLKQDLAPLLQDRTPVVQQSRPLVMQLLRGGK
jgi:hypothetical protein